MTGKLDKRMRALGQRLVGTYGKSVTLRRTTSSFDPSTGQTTESTTDYATSGVLENYADSRTDGTLIQTGDLQVTVPALNLSVTPDQETDSLMIDSEAWTIVNLSRIYSGEQQALYQMQVRQ